MTRLDIGAQFSGQIFAFVLVLCRIGSVFHLFPGFGESFVPVRIRLVLAMAVSFLLYTIVEPRLPALPHDPAALAFLIGREVLIGLFFGSLLRAILSAVEAAGSVIGVQIGLSNAMIMNPSQAMQSALPSALLSMAAVTLIFITGLDHYLLEATVKTYDIFPADQAIKFGDMAQVYTNFVSRSFQVGIELAAPFLIVGLLMFVVLGVIQRMMANVQLFMIVLPIQILGGLAFFAVTAAAILTVWLRYYDEAITNISVR